MDAAQAVAKSTFAPPRQTPGSDALTARYADARAIWAAGDVSVAEDRLAMNFLMDRSPETWRTVLSRLKDQAGECDTGSPITPNGALQGNFQWVCARGRVNGRVLLAPTQPPTFQALNFGFTPNPAAN